MDGEAAGEVNWMRCSGIEAWEEAEMMHRGRRSNRNTAELRRATRLTRSSETSPPRVSVLESSSSEWALS